ncbi:MAG: TetR/AcrR family transcriptional regulator [Anaerolineae bacterium]|nr:TetR/AcrR family transcriptional regulator [Anaerolineae bacterium]
MEFELSFGEPRRERSDSVRNRELLLETAQRLFAEQGVECVTMSAVAEAAGVGKGTLYRHFPNKTQLLQELIDTDQRDLQERTFHHIGAHAAQPAACLDWFLAEVVAFVGRHQLLFFGQMGDLSLSLLEHPAHVWWRLTIRGLLARQRLTLDLDYATDLLYLLLDPRTIHFQKLRHGYDDEALIRHLVTFAHHLTGDRP